MTNWRTSKLMTELQRLVARGADRDRKRDGTAMEFGLTVALAAYRLGFARGKASRQVKR